jgi:hypothetical protein
MAELSSDEVFEISTFLQKNDFLKIRLVSHIWREAISFNIKSFSFEIPSENFTNQSNTEIHQVLYDANMRPQWREFYFENIKKATIPKIGYYYVLYGTSSLILIPSFLDAGIITKKSNFFKNSRNESVRLFTSPPCSE